MSTFTLQEDTADEFKWSRIETERDDQGDVISRYTVYDNGTTRGQSYEDGILRYLVQEDLDTGGGQSDVKPWESIEKFYDETGQIQDQYTRYDNGTTLGQSYEDGVLRYAIQEDLGAYGGSSDVKPWESVEKFFDVSGQLESQFIRYDNGVTFGQGYENGVLRHTLKEDFGPSGGSSDAKPWQRIEQFFDETGQKTSQYELRDNGVTIAKEFEDGMLRVMTQEDKTPTGGSSSVKAWDSITSFYDDTGTISAKETVFDNQDVTAFFFDDGMRALKLEFDGDDSHSWLVRETIYDDNNQVLLVNTYDTYDNVPADYGWLG